MKNSKNKFIAGIVSGIIVGSIGTSFIGKFEADKQQLTALNSQNTFDSSQNDSQSGYNEEQGNSTPPSLENGQRPMKQKGGHHQGQGSLEASGSVDIEDGQYSDGTYKGTASGYASGLSVSVQVSSGKISSIEITSHNETPGFYEKAFETVPNEIIQKQSTNVDTVSGATYSSVGIINAVNQALNNASSSQNTQTQSSTTDNFNLELSNQ